MKKLILFFTCLSFLNFSAQSLEDRVADETCKCIRNLPSVTEDAYTDCMGTALANALAESDDKKLIRKKVKNVDRMLETLKTVQARLDTTCDVKVLRDPIIAKRDSVYSSHPSAKSMELYRSGKKLMEKSNFREAISYFEKAVVESPNYVLALDDMAKSYRELQEYDTAVKYYEKSLAVFPEGEFALMNGAVAYMKMKNFPPAKELYTKLAAYYPENAEGYFGLGQVNLLLEDHEHALRNMCKALRIYHETQNPYLKDAQVFVSAIYQEMEKKGNGAQALKIAEEYGIKLK